MEFLKEETYNYIVENYPNLRSIFNASEEELHLIPGITKCKANQLIEYIELCKRLLIPQEQPEKISSPRDVFNIFEYISYYQEEHMIVLLLDTKNNVIAHFDIGKGSLNSCIVHPREFFSPAIRLKAGSVIAIHNHPSGDAQASSEDIELTQRLLESGKILGINLIDSIIIGTGYFSFKEEGLL